LLALKQHYTPGWLAHQLLVILMKFDNQNQ